MKDKLKELLILFIAFSPVIIPVVIIVSTLFLTEPLSTKQESYQDLSLQKLTTIEYDACEYVTNGLHKENAVLVHKGNCKYCVKRKR